LQLLGYFTGKPPSFSGLLFFSTTNIRRLFENELAKKHFIKAIELKKASKQLITLPWMLFQF